MSSRERDRDPTQAPDPGVDEAVDSPIVDRAAGLGLERRRIRRFFGNAAASDAWFRAFFDQGALFAGIMDLAGTILEPNRISLEASGYRRDQVVGRPFWECPWWSPSSELAARVRAGSMEAAEGRTFQAELPYFIADGSQRLVELVILPIKDVDGEVLFLAPTGTDVTDRKRAEMGLRLLLESATVLLSAEDLDVMLRQLFVRVGPHLGVDAYFSHLVDPTGCTLELVSWGGLPESVRGELERLPVEGSFCGSVVRTRRAVTLGREESFADEALQALRGVGIGAYSCHPLLADGRVVGTLCYASRTKPALVGEDLSFLETISRYVTLAYERLRLIEELRETHRRKDGFLATLAHELRNPLAPMRNALGLLQRDDATPAQRDRSHLMLDRQLEHLVRLIDDLLEVSRIATGKVRLRREQVEVTSILEGAVEEATPMVEAAGLELRLELPTESIPLDADPARLTQVLMNLLSNAAKYTERGGTVWLGARREHDAVVISVRDSGIGIASDQLPHLFEMFAQATPAIERSQGGLGIGLSLVRSLVELHGGTVVARSDGPGRGSEFRVTLPLGESVAASVVADRRAPEVVDRGPRRVLVVDDNRDAADSLVTLLDLEGHDVRVAYDGHEALVVAAAFEPDVVVLDIGLPGISGYDVALRFRAEPWGRRAWLVALTGWGQAEDKRRATEAGFDRHLTKPVDLETLSALFADAPRGPSVTGRSSERLA